MSLRRKLARASDLARAYRQDPRDTATHLRHVHEAMRGFRYANAWSAEGAGGGNNSAVHAPSRLFEYFDAHRTGRGIWKWLHYFDIYERHFGRFRGREVHLLEVGIYSGGSLDMWRDYFGPGCHVYGVDIEAACRAYDRPDENIRVLIGDQSDRAFWRRTLTELPPLDIVIDDGSHVPAHQIITLEETVPRLAAGGVYLCEDVHGDRNDFTAYIGGLLHQLNASRGIGVDPNTETPGSVAGPRTAFQQAIASIHCYPFVVAIEREFSRRTEFRAPKHGTEWQPFL